MSSSYPPAIQAEIDKFEKEQSRLLKERARLDSIFSRLSSKQNPTDADKAQIADIQTQIFNIITQLEKNKMAESEIIHSVIPEGILLAAQKQELLKTILITTDKPAPGMLSIVHPTISPADVISYMTLTQHLNPYGRKRQCDTDLENLMAIINIELLNAMGDNNDLNKKISEF